MLPGTFDLFKIKVELQFISLHVIMTASHHNLMKLSIFLKNVL